MTILQKVKYMVAGATVFCMLLVGVGLVDARSKRPPRKDKELAPYSEYLVQAIITVGIDNNVWNKNEVLNEAKKLKNEVE